MIQQLSLDGFAAGQPPTDRLFFGIFPSPPVAARLDRMAQGLCVRHALTGKPLAPDRFHITLFHLGDYVGLPETRVRAAMEAATTVTAPPFDVLFDCTESFLGKSRSLPLVLRASIGAERLMSFQQNLGDALKKAGLGRYVSPQFTPHVTLLYDMKTIPREPADPEGWMVSEFVLVHSLLGQTRHVQLGRWPLSG